MRQVKPNVFSVGAIDWDRRLFDELIPLPEGTSYNAYVVKGSKKTALMDTVDPEKADTLVNNLIACGVEQVDYIVAHHGEQDHSGAIPDILTIYPSAKIVANKKCKSMLIHHLHLKEEDFITITEGETLSLGDKTLQFFNLPWVHWPETFGTYLQEDKIMFTCDFFGSHIASTDLFVTNEFIVCEAAKRYYAEIMMPFRGPIKRNLEKLDKLDIDMIAPSHGPVYDKPALIINAYKDWVSDKVKNEVLLPFVSMHQSTRAMVDHCIDALIDRGITVKPFDMAKADTGKLAIALVDAATIVVGSPTVLGGAHPSAAYAVLLANALRPKVKFASIIGSFGWGGKMVEQITGLMPYIKAEILDPVVVQGLPREEAFQLIDNLADQILAKHQEIGIA